eukprot:GHVT01063910.1.p1 GENE.GHVT01063910.1~~GHVT01063910.1.p1  ORF type:complete len:477 (-),score=34.73 GHVT01063910.1:396-1826(-)
MQSPTEPSVGGSRVSGASPSGGDSGSSVVSTSFGENQPPPQQRGDVRMTIDEVVQELEAANGAASQYEDEDSAYGQYSWEQDVERSWDLLVEQDGRLQFRHAGDEFKRSYLDAPEAVRQGCIRKGMIRNMLLLVDMSNAMREMDFRPDRLNCALACAEAFIREFFHQNPISQLGSIVMRSMTAVDVQPLSPNPDDQIAKLRKAKREGTDGAPSLQNGLQRACSMLTLIPPYGTREILIIFGSIRTCDSGNIHETIKKVKDAHIRVNVVSMAPELYILKHICKETDGTYAVALNKDHFKDLLLQQTQPPPWAQGMKPTLVRMGFPPLKKQGTAILCTCHNRVNYQGYLCPQCGAQVCQVPTRCPNCFLHLVSPADIARSFHHLFPPRSFTVVAEPLNPTKFYRCHTCRVKFRKGGGRCPDCRYIFCYDCDVYAHEQLHHCPPCVARDIRCLDPQSSGEAAKLIGPSSAAVPCGQAVV